MAAKLRDTLQIDAELIEGSNGVFDVVADGRLIFSKHEASRFPEPGEILDALGRLTT